MRRADGQGTIEYVAVVLLVGILLVSGVSLVGAPVIANAVGRAMARALCDVTGRACPTLDPEPCTLRSTSTSGKVGVRVVVIRAGREMRILRTEKSDGTIALTLLDHRDLGLETMLGGKARVELGDDTIGTGAAAEAALIARYGGGRTWKVRSPAAADALQRKLYEVAAGRAAGGGILGVPNPVDLATRALHRGAHLALPVPDSTVQSGSLEAGAGAKAGPLGGMSGSLGLVIGRERGRDGGTTWLGTLQAEVGASLLEELGVEAKGEGSVKIAVTTGADGRLRSLTVSGAGAVSGQLAVPLAQARATGVTGGEVEVSATLDLEDEGPRTAVTALLDGLRGADLGQVRRAAGAVAGHLRDDAAIDVAAYRKDTDAYGGEAAGGAEVQLGVEARFARERSRLAGAWWRPPGGAWQTRLDCRA